MYAQSAAPHNTVCENKAAPGDIRACTELSNYLYLNNLTHSYSQLYQSLSDTLLHLL